MIFEFSQVLNLCLEKDQHVLMHPALTEADSDVYSTLKRQLNVLTDKYNQ